MQRVVVVFFVVLFLTVGCCVQCRAAFPIHAPTEGNNYGTAPDGESGWHHIKTKIRNFLSSHDEHYHKFEYKTDRTRAALLSVPCFGGLFGLGRFYMEYNMQGVLQCAATVLAIVAFIMAAALQSGLFMLVAVPVYAAFLCCVYWETADAVRIILNDLHPKWGDWL